MKLVLIPAYSHAVDFVRGAQCIPPPPPQTFAQPDVNKHTSFQHLGCAPCNPPTRSATELPVRRFREHNHCDYHNLPQCHRTTPGRLDVNTTTARAAEEPSAAAVAPDGCREPSSTKPGERHLRGWRECGERQPSHEQFYDCTVACIAYDSSCGWGQPGVPLLVGQGACCDVCRP